MEVSEILNYYVNRDNNVIEVEFRFMSDDEDVVREDIIEYAYLSEFGYQTEQLYDPPTEWDDDFDYVFGEEDDEYISEDDMVSFLNEYYVLYPEKIPNTEII